MGLQYIRNAWSLGLQMFRFDLQERYTGTMLGVFWLLLHPLFMLLVYTFIFGEVLQFRFNTNDSTTQFAFYLFTGLLVFNAFSEVLIRAPVVLIERRDLLLNTPLPAWLLPVLPVVISVVLEVIALLILLLAVSLQGDFKPLGLFFYLHFLLIRIIFSLAGAYTMAVLGVFLRDLRQLMPVLMTVLLFISPVLYPLEVVPEKFHIFYEWNILGQLITGYREALLEGVILWGRFSALLMVALLSLGLSVWMFRSLLPRARYVL